MEYTNHALARFFSRYRKEITVEELLYIQTQIKYRFDEAAFAKDDVTHIGRIRREGTETLDCYYGIYDEIEYFALCPEGMEIVITFLDVDFDVLNHLE